MGRLIDADICLHKAWQNFYKQEEEHQKNIDGYDIMRDQFYEQSGFECCQQTIVDVPTVDAIPKAEVRKLLRDNAENISGSILDIVKEEYIPKSQYENRLKADMVAMLEEISLEIEEKTKDPALDDYDCGFNTGVYVLRDIIQQKIDALKAENKMN